MSGQQQHGIVRYSSGRTSSSATEIHSNACRQNGNGKRWIGICVFDSGETNADNSMAQKWWCHHAEWLHADCWRVSSVEWWGWRWFTWRSRQFSRHNLRILGLIASDAGMFQCIGSNPAGSVQASARLEIGQPSKFCVCYRRVSWGSFLWANKPCCWYEDAFKAIPNHYFVCL